MTKKILLASLLGGIAMFAWEAVAHMVLPLGESGVRTLDNEAAVIATLKASVDQPGFYLFPSGGLKPGMTSAEKQECMRRMAEQWRAGPAGILVVHPEGIDIASSRHYIAQGLLDMAAILVAAFLLSKASALTGFGARLLFVTLIGLVPTLSAELPYWNWYGFPNALILSQAVVHLVGFLVAGLVAAKLVKPRTA